MVSEYRTSQFCSACVEASVADKLQAAGVGSTWHASDKDEQHQGIPLQPWSRCGTYDKYKKREENTAAWESNPEHSGQTNPRHRRDPNPDINLTHRLIHPKYPKVIRRVQAVPMVGPDGLPHPPPAAGPQVVMRAAFSAVLCPCCNAIFNRDFNSARNIATCGKCSLIGIRPPVLERNKAERALKQVYTAMWWADRDVRRLSKEIAAAHSRGDEGGAQKLTQRRDQMVSDIRADLAKHKHVSDKGGEEETEFRDKNPLIRDLLDKAQERYEKLMTLLEDMDLLPKAKKQQKVRDAHSHHYLCSYNHALEPCTHAGIHTQTHLHHSTVGGTVGGSQCVLCRC